MFGTEQSACGSLASPLDPSSESAEESQLKGSESQGGVLGVLAI